jgi:hypothetical protein
LPVLEIMDLHEGMANFPGAADYLVGLAAAPRAVPIVGGRYKIRAWRDAAGRLQGELDAYRARRPAGDATLILSLGQQQYRLGDGPVVLVSDVQDDVLQAFLDNAPGWKAASRLTTAELESRTRSTGQIHRVMKALKEGRLGAGIDLPGRGRKGQGYGVNIRRCAPTFC